LLPSLAVKPNEPIEKPRRVRQSQRRPPSQVVAIILHRTRERRLGLKNCYSGYGLHDDLAYQHQTAECEAFYAISLLNNVILSLSKDL